MPIHSAKAVKYECEVCPSQITKSRIVWACACCSCSSAPVPICSCGNYMSEGYRIKRGRMAAVHPSERAAVWRGPNGEIRVPMQNDIPMPEKYRALGYERQEFNSLHEIDQFERQTGMTSEKAHYDDGSGTKRPDHEYDKG